MTLHFLGQTYSTDSKQMATFPSGNTACYRGQRYSIPSPIVSSSSQPDKSQLTASVRKYRGVSYVVECQNFPLQDEKKFFSNIHSR